MALAKGTTVQAPRPKKTSPPPPPLVGHHAENASRAHSPSTRYPWLRFSSGIDWVHTSPTLLERMNMIGRLIGKPITIISGFRTHTQQRQLYANYQSGTGGIAAQPGHSYHEKGLAVDALVDGQAIGNVVPQDVFQRAGLHNLIDINDAPHVQLENANAPVGALRAQETSVGSAESYQVPNASTGLTDPVTGIPASGQYQYETPVLPFDVGQAVQAPAPILNQQQIAETWQMIASQDGASPETIQFARRMNSGAS